MILLITPFFSPNMGGVEVHLWDYVQVLIKKKIKVFVLTYKPITSKGKAPFKEIIGSATIYRFPYIGYNLFYKLDAAPLINFVYLIFGIFFYSLFFLMFNSSKIEVIHGQGLAAGLTAGILGKIFKKKSIISLHTIYKFSQRPKIALLAKPIFSLDDQILAISKGCKDDLIKIGVEEEKIIIYSYWVNVDNFRLLNQSQCRRKLHLPKGFIALFVGRFTPEKQINEALEVASRSPEALFLFIGQGPLEKRVREYAEKFRNIKLVGRVENNIIPFYYNSANILLLGSVDENYFGKVTMEAMACGLPVLLSNYSNYFGKRMKINTKILPKKCGFFVKNDISSISKKILELQKSPKKLSLMRISCREFALNNFGSQNARTIINAYSF